LEAICINLLRFSRKKALDCPKISTKIWGFDINTVTFLFEIPVKQNKNFYFYWQNVGILCVFTGNF